MVQQRRPFSLICNEEIKNFFSRKRFRFVNVENKKLIKDRSIFHVGMAVEKEKKKYKDIKNDSFSPEQKKKYKKIQRE